MGTIRHGEQIILRESPAEGCEDIHPNMDYEGSLCIMIKLSSSSCCLVCIILSTSTSSTIQTLAVAFLAGEDLRALQLQLRQCLGGPDGAMPGFRPEDHNEGDFI